jgi:predicted  nucleic acid-binding Zn-ribbon protein
MESPLMLLIALQDIDFMIQEAGDPEQSGAHAELGFKVKNLDALINSRRHLAEQLDPRTLGLYERMRKRYGRAVVPVESQVCLGCFMGMPTKNVGTSGAKDDRVETCENCGRILYYL